MPILDADTRLVIQDALDELYANESEGGLGKTCLIVYPPKAERCENCIYDPVTNRSSNRPRNGAPIPFPPGASCPLCGGKGLKETEVTEELTLKTNWEFKRFRVAIPNLEIRTPYSLVKTKGFLTDLPKLLKADHIVIDVPIMPYLKKKFRLLGEPGDPSNIVQGRYFVAVWEQFG